MFVLFPLLSSGIEKRERGGILGDKKKEKTRRWGLGWGGGLGGVGVGVVLGGGGLGGGLGGVGGGVGGGGRAGGWGVGGGGGGWARKEKRRLSPSPRLSKLIFSVHHEKGCRALKERGIDSSPVGMNPSIEIKEGPGEEGPKKGKRGGSLLTKGSPLYAEEGKAHRGKKKRDYLSATAVRKGGELV